MAMAVEKSVHEEEETDADAPVRYLPLTRLYSATSACINPGGGLLSVKVHAREPVVERVAARGGEGERSGKPPVIRVYERRRKRRRVDVGCGVGGGLEPALVSGWGIRGEEVGTGRKGAKLRVLDGVRGQVRDKRDFPRQGKADWVEYIKRKRKSDSPSTKRWVELCFDNVDQNAFVGLYCKVYWPLDDKWYNGSVIGYSQETQKHQIKYDDSDVESLKLFSEKIKFHVSREEMECLNIKISNSKIDKEGAYFDELVALAASFDDCPNLEPGDILWAKLTGHSKWPAIVIGEAHVSACKSLKQLNGERRTIPVQFFGTHDFARIKLKQAIPFLRGLLSSFHTKCKQTRFDRALEEARMYLRERKLPKKMVWVQNGYEVDEGGTDSDDDENVGDMGGSGAGGEGIAENTCPLQFRDLQVLKLGKIVRDSPHFFNKHYIWPEGYTAVRKFISVTDSRKFVIYKMEVLRNPQVKAKPLFRVTMKNGKQIDGSTPTACWKKIYKKLKLRNNLANGIHGRKMTMDGICKSGSFMFGFSIKKIKKLIKGLPGARIYWKSSCNNLVSQGTTNQLSDYRPVHVEWKDLDKCNVCHMDEEYLNNLFLQCDKCRMMVHARCYGEEPMDGVLWLCNLCREGAPSSPPLCCLCPVTGGAMKPTTDGRWAHLTCAMWIPETCLLDVRKMEPIDGIERISKDRWKLLCSICGVSYGACIQCSNNACRIAYHPLCARAAGLCVELADEDIIHFRSVDEDEDHQCIRLFSFCKKHKQPSNDHSIQEEQMVQAARSSSSYTPPSNPSGCARCEPYNHLGRRGLKEPEALVAASVKRAFVENIPYLVSGFRQNRSFGSAFPNELLLSYVSSCCQKVRCPQVDPPESVLSMAEKYKYMKLTFCKRLAFGKSRIHGFGIFAKQSYKAGDMVIEYIGELVRPPVADIREHAIYNSLVGAGTYMFRIDDERVIDATRAGSIAHLINHSCEPNCYSRMITVHGDEHIIIYAKRDINQWEELTYDYRFFSIEEKLPCYCGFPRCRGVVNDFETEERLSKLNVPRSELIEWKED